MVTIRAIKANELTPALIDIWSDLQLADSAVDSPYFRPEFTLAIADVRDNVEVAVVCEDAQVVGFFPFQRSTWNTGYAAGGCLSDAQGMIAKPGVQWKAEDLVRECNLTALHFNPLVASQEQFLEHHHCLHHLPCMDLSSGFEAYRQERKRAGSSRIKKSRQKARKMEREVGPWRYEVNTTDPRAFDLLIQWKSAQYKRTHVPNRFAMPGGIEILNRLLSYRSENFAGMLSALYIGDNPVAVELIIRSRNVLCKMVCGYDPNYARYSPGTMLVIETAKAAESMGIERIDLGTGTEAYKQSLASGYIALAEGSVDTNPLRLGAMKAWRSLRDGLRASPLKGVLRGPWRRTFRIREKLVLR